MRSRIPLLMLLGLTGAGVWIGIVHAQSEPSQPASAIRASDYHERISATYDFSFGKGLISAPGSAGIEGNRFVSPSVFLSAEYCGKCHPQAYQQWRQALHSNSFRTPFYRTSVNILLRTKGIEFTRHCDSCHNPVGVLSGALTKNSTVDRQFDDDGLTCTTCHSIQGVIPVKGNGGFTMGIPAVMVDENGKRIPGEVPDSEIFAHRDRHAKAVMQTFYRSAEFCGSCHKANLPNGLNDYKFLRAFTVYDEWQNSKFSRRNPLTFYQGAYTTCQNCHMPRSAAIAGEYGAKNGTFASHRWPAGNTAVPVYYGFDDQLKQTLEFLQTGLYLNVDIFGMRSLPDGKLTAPLGSMPVELSPNEAVETLVVIQNKNIGHSLVPEVRDLYEPWVEFIVKDAAGKDIYHSGFVKPDGAIDPKAHSFTNRPVNTDGTFVDNHKVWTIHSMAYDNSIQSGRSALIRYRWCIPANAAGPITITARVNYRHLRQSYMNNVFGTDHPAYPIVELASRTRTFVIGNNPPSAPEPKDNADWMRWNNLGIAYLDQLQYSEAIRMFSEVLKLRPDYADGYTNVGLTNIEWEKYSEARPSLEKALSLDPKNARALFYLGLVDRRERNSDAEVSDFEQVVAQYPECRDARRELGISYYQQHRTAEARAQFEALQRIDPDDVAAHYNLSILYRRLGMNDKSADQVSLFTTKQIDPGAPTYSLEFLRKHPEISNESVPWHVHADPSMPEQHTEALPEKHIGAQR